MRLKSFLKNIYDLVPLKKEIFCLIRFFTIPPKSIYQHLHFKGIFKVKINDDKKFKIQHLGFIAENEIFWEGIYNGWEKKSMSLWIELSKTSQTIFDIGANTGVYALVAKTMNPQASVYAFEPLPAVFEILKKNIDINKFEIKNYQLGLSDYDGIAEVYLQKDQEFAYSVTINKNTLPTQEAKCLNINVQKLSTFIKANNIASIDLMKIDVETHEFEVLSGMGSYLLDFKPTLIIEVLSEEIADKLHSLLKDMDYLYFNIDDVKNIIRKTDRISKSDHWNILCCNHATAVRLNLI